MRFFQNEVKVKESYEPSLVILAGIALCFWNAPLGAWCIFSGFCGGCATAWNSERDKAKVQAMIDAKLEAQRYAEMFRKEVGEE